MGEYDGLVRILPAREQVAAAIRKAILTRELKAGQEIVLKDMAKQLGVSSTPVREALQMLSRDGLIELHPNKQAVVVGLSRQHVTEFYETLAVLEAACAKYAALRAENFDVLRNILEKQKAAVESGFYSQSNDWNTKFHETIRDMCGNRRLQRMIADIRQSTTRVLYVEQPQVQLAEHMAVYEAIVARDARRAEELTEQHMLSKLKQVLSQDAFSEDEVP